ncbi:hypothetical protein [Empedobacter sp.]|uniref:hypothetical protein n=1 Tax=Empedobacter sp. TaxID=1927715 RepID=UPI0028AC8631|nr:hypothetical protein [Empedobacter sp.]
MEKQYFRVELGPVDTAVIYDTTTKNYGQSLNFAPYVHYLQVYLSVMKSNNISADILPIISNNIYNLQDDYLNQLSQAIVDEEYIDLYELTNLNEHRFQRIPIAWINHFIQSFDEHNQFVYIDNGTYLWEYLSEFVRMNFYPDKPKRLESTFLFDTIESCNYYITKHLRGNGKIYEVELIEIDQLFEGDMKIIDDIPTYILFEDLINEFDAYWQGQEELEPVKEFIFQGKFRYK